MRKIDMQTWPRRDHFQFFRQFDHPHFNMCANVDLSKFYPFVRQHQLPFTVTFVYILTRTANAIPEFRHRIRSEEVVEHEVVHPSITLLVKDDLFAFCTFLYDQDFTIFAKNALEKIAYVKEHPGLINELDDEVLYMSPIPWVSFTSFTHPMQLHPADSIPRFAWGKYEADRDTMKMPLSVQGHHAVMDGIHMGKFYALIQSFLDEPEIMLA
jgi:chloramphenicol O-acetyltransferase type A